MKSNEVPIVYDKSGEPWNNPAPAGWALVGFIVVFVVVPVIAVAVWIVRMP